VIKAVFVFAIATLGLCFLAAWPSPAQAAACGGKDQRPCKVWERIPSCNKGLYENFGKGRCLAKAVPGKDCGRENQRPCKVWERIPSCNPGMVEDFAKGKCVRNRDAELRQLASKLIAGAAAHQRTMSKIAGCMANPARMNRFQTAVKKKDMKTAQSVTNQCVSPAEMASLRAAPQGLARAPSGKSAQQYFNSLSIGIGAGAMVFIGGDGELGLDIDLDGKLPPRFYTSGDYAFGLGVNVGADVIVSVSRDQVVPNVSNNLSVVAAGKYLAGGGIAAVFNYGDPLKDDVFNGFAVNGGAGVGAEIGTIHKSNSRVW
jgi:hypothetical protein